MAITYSNTIYDDIMETLATIVNNEFSVPVYYDEHKPPQSFLFTPESDDLIDHLASGIHREYTINISYELKSGGQYTKNNFKQISNTMERLKRLVFNNISYSNGDTWFDARISSIGYERDEDDQSLLRGLAVFNCSNIEII
tara:strand:- start:4444 stop:4866 length:423 start_codon:yes stop_codon:yes gene_type:complete